MRATLSIRFAKLELAKVASKRMWRSCRSHQSCCYKEGFTQVSAVKYVFMKNTSNRLCARRFVRECTAELRCAAASDLNWR